MPGGDRTGPMGRGPGTGRAIGYCHGFDFPGYAKGSKRGMNMGGGFGGRFAGGLGSNRGRGFSPYFHGRTPGYPWMFSMNREDEVKMLKSEAEALKRSQQEIEKRLAELEKVE